MSCRGSLCHSVEPFKKSPFDKGVFNQLLAEIYPNGERIPNRRFIAVAWEDIDTASKSTTFGGRVVSFLADVVNQINCRLVDGTDFPQSILTDEFSPEEEVEEYRGFRSRSGFKRASIITHYAIEMAAGMESRVVDEETKSYALAILAKFPSIPNVGVHVSYVDCRVDNVTFFNLTS